VASADLAPPATGSDGKPKRPQFVPGSFEVVAYEMTEAGGHGCSAAKP
jgi:hypothetical protein